MKTTQAGSFCLAVMLLLGAVTAAHAQLPPDFPAITVSNYNPSALATGYVFIAAMPVSKGNLGLPYYLLILNNDGSPHAYKKTWYKTPGDFYENDFKVLPNGQLHYSQFFGFYSYTGGGTVEHVILDEDLNEIPPRYQMKHGYVCDSHDFEMLPNGHTFLIGYYTTLTTNLSAIVNGAYPRAEISGGVIQELDADRNVVWQWRAWDHFQLSEYPYWDAGSTAAASAGWHVNVVRLDPKDGNLFMTTTEEVMKINRQTGDVMWRLGGGANQFTFVGVDPVDALEQLGGHDFHRLPNGNVIIYDGGAADLSRTSRVHEYQLDETNKIATHIWSYVATELIPNWARGSAQRLPNGNTFIGWGTCSVTNINPPDCTEVAPDGTKLWEMWFDHPLLNSYRAFREPYPPSVQRVQAIHTEIAAGNSYDFGSTGVGIDVTDRTGDGYNSITVYREPYSPVSPLFFDKAPMLLPVRINVSQTAIDSITAQISFDVNTFGVTDPTNTTVYYRETPGTGIFVPLDTQYNLGTHRLVAPLPDFGEFALGFPDIAEVPFPPLLIEPESLQSTGFVTRVPPLVVTGRVYTVNQQLPIALTWTPKGFAGSYALQISTNADYSTPDADVPFTTEARYIFTNASANTPYFWRVKTTNAGGDSDWAANAFATVPPAIQVTAPHAGDILGRGLPTFLQWDDNILENVAIELYKGGVFVKNINTNAPSTTSFKWTVDLSLVPGNDYTIKIRSATNAALFSVSPEFAICSYTLSVTNVIVSAVATNGSFAVEATNGCPWTAVSGVGWIHTSSTGSGSGTVNYSVDGNGSASSRTGSVTVAGQVCKVSQSGNAPPQVNITPVTPVTLPVTQVNLNATVTDDGAPTGTLTATWSKFSGAGSVTFGNPTSANTTATFSTNGTYVLQLLASDGALSTSNNVTVIVNARPVITVPPTVTNGIAQIGNVAIVLAGATNYFTAGVTDADGNPISCLWSFGDGGTSTDCNPSHVYTNCQPFTVTFGATDGIATNTSSTGVTVPCTLDLTNRSTRLKLNLNFRKPAADSSSLKAMIAGGSGFSPAGKTATLDIGGAQVSFTLDSKARDVGPYGSCRLTYNKRTGIWTLTANLKKGAWRDNWAAYGLINTNTPKGGITRTIPVIVLTGDEAFMAEKPLRYTAKAGKSGTAK